jgi:superfamily II DNA helicase RecQ
VEENSVLVSLRHWRAGMALTMGVPAYTVIPDAVLSAIARAQPQSRLDLARIQGVGPRALAKFGDDLLGIMGFSVSRSS